jgi:hypothetical protein
MVVMTFPPWSIEAAFDYSEQQMCQTSAVADRGDCAGRRIEVSFAGSGGHRNRVSGAAGGDNPSGLF